MAESNRKLRIRNNLQILIAWKAKERLWEPKQQRWYLISAVVILFFIFVAVRLEYWLMLVALVAFMGLWFLSGYIEPWEVEHKVTSKGIFTFSNLFIWQDISHFWFARKKDQLLLYIDFPKDSQRNRLTILVPDEVEFELFHILIEYLDYGDPNQVEYNFLAQIIYGKYIPISDYISDLDSLTEDI